MHLKPCWKSKGFWMGFNPDLIACAGLVQRGDPDRFMAAMASPIPVRHVLFPLYALNVEVARVPWVTSETMIAEIRLQWWRDALQEIAKDSRPRHHEVVTPLAGWLTSGQAEKLDQMIAARRWDIYTDPFDDAAKFAEYIDQTSGNLMWIAAQALGPANEAVVRDFAYAAGLANWLRAVPELRARGRIPLVEDTPEYLRELASDGLKRLDRARAAKAQVSRAAAPALLVGWQAKAILKQVVADPDRVEAATLGRGEITRRLSLMKRVVTGGW